MTGRRNGDGHSPGTGRETAGGDPVGACVWLLLRPHRDDLERQTLRDGAGQCRTLHRAKRCEAARRGVSGATGRKNAGWRGRVGVQSGSPGAADSCSCHCRLTRSFLKAALMPTRAVCFLTMHAQRRLCRARALLAWALAGAVSSIALAQAPPSRRPPPAQLEAAPPASRAAQADPQRPGSPALDAAFRRADRDSDGRLSRQETDHFPMLAERFEQIDRDQDRHLSRDEFQRAVQD